MRRRARLSVAFSGTAGVTGLLCSCVSYACSREANARKRIEVNCCWAFEIAYHIGVVQGVRYDGQS